jgi:NAD(P)-dependent dehydrogenase (short-subunit alcohol dehydrogenase family)/acyl carrier protein
MGRELARWLHRQHQAVVTVEIGPCFKQLDVGIYQLDPSSPESYQLLFADLVAVGFLPRKIVHLWTVSGPDATVPAAQWETRGFYSLLLLAQAMALLGSELPRAVLAVVSNRLHDVLGGEPLDPEKALLLGPVKVISQELPSIRCQSIDIGEAKGARPESQQIEALLAELRCRPNDPVVAYRGAHRWVRTFDAVQLPSGGKSPLREKGVYLITGGLGKLGLALARRLAEQLQARLVLMGRSSLPSRDEWRELLATGAEESLSRKLRALQEIEQRAGGLLVLQGDVTNADDMHRVLRETRERFGQIHGIFHAAGVANLGLIEQKTTQDAADTLAPKVRGTRLLSELFRGEELDFLLLFSSLSSVVGGIALVDYSAANAFLEAMAYSNNRTGGVRTVAINWGPWNVDVANDAQGLRAIGVSEGMKILERILVHRLSQVVVSPRDLDLELHTVEQLRREEAASRPTSKGRRPRVLTPYLAPRDELEEELAAIWGELLGIEEIGVDDNFLQLGGHSLVGTRLVSRIRESFGVVLSLTEMLVRPTIAELTVVIAERQAEQRGTSLSDLVAEVRQLSVHDLSESLESLSMDSHEDGLR